MSLQALEEAGVDAGMTRATAEKLVSIRPAPRPWRLQAETRASSRHLQAVRLPIPGKQVSQSRLRHFGDARQDVG